MQTPAIWSEIQVQYREPGHDIAQRLLRLSIAAEEISRHLPSGANGRHVSTQLVRSATAAGANYDEARSPESRADFIHKLGIALKELREARYWLSFVAGSKMAAVDPVLLDEARQLIAILMASRRTAASKE